jgi:hypothetical protein
MHPWAAGAQLGAELQEGGELPDRIRALSLRLDDFVDDVTTRPALPPLHEYSDGDRRRQEEGEAYESAHEGHSRSAYLVAPE